MCMNCYCTCDHITKFSGSHCTSFNDLFHKSSMYHYCFFGKQNWTESTKNWRLGCNIFKYLQHFRSIGVEIDWMCKYFNVRNSRGEKISRCPQIAKFIPVKIIFYPQKWILWDLWQVKIKKMHKNAQIKEFSSQFAKVNSREIFQIAQFAKMNSRKM